MALEASDSQACGASPHSPGSIPLPAPGRCDPCRAATSRPVEPRYLPEEADRRAIIGGLRMARRIFAAPALQQFVSEETLPGRQVQSDARIARLHAAQSRHLLSRQLHLPDGEPRDDRDGDMSAGDTTVITTRIDTPRPTWPRGRRTRTRHPAHTVYVPYRVKGDVVQIITILRSAQRWPDRLP